MLLTLILVVLAIRIYLFLTHSYSYWKKRGIPHLKPWPIVGNMAENLFATHAFCYIIQKLYNKFPSKRYFGFHAYTNPIIMLRDPDLIKQMFVTDFEIFPNHPPMLPEEADPFTNKTLFFLKGKTWHDTRATLSLAFSSNKMKLAFDNITKVAKRFVTYHAKLEGVTIVDAKDVFTRIANDVAAGFALGVECDSLNDRNNEMYKIGKTFTETPFLSILKYFACALSPSLMKILKPTFYNPAIQKILEKMIKERMTGNSGVVQSDIIRLLLGSKSRLPQYNNNNKHLDQDYVFQNAEDIKHSNLDISEEEIIAQVVLFYSAGVDAPVSLWGLILYELALNQAIQEKLYTEVELTLEHCKGELTYEALLDMKYLQMVISETLRLWPVAVLLDRISVKPYTIHSNDPEEKPIHLEAGTYIWAPTFALHRDPKYFPNPNKFDPERFSEENKKHIQPFTYLPFGIGPRNCVAYRYVLLKCKVILFYILLNFEVIPVKETQIPFAVNKTAYILASSTGPFLGLKLRKKSI